MLLHELLHRAERLSQADRRPVLVVHNSHPVRHVVVVLSVQADVAAPEVEHADTRVQLGPQAEVLGGGPRTNDRVVLPSATYVVQTTSISPFYVFGCHVTWNTLEYTSYESTEASGPSEGVGE